MSPRQQALVCLAQIRTTFALSTGTCGSPRIRPPILSMNAMRSDDTGRRIRSGALEAALQTHGEFERTEICHVDEL